MSLRNRSCFCGGCSLGRLVGRRVWRLARQARKWRQVLVMSRGSVRRVKWGAYAEVKLAVFFSFHCLSDVPEGGGSTGP